MRAAREHAADLVILKSERGATEMFSVFRQWEVIHCLRYWPMHGVILISLNTRSLQIVLFFEQVEASDFMLICAK